METWEVLVVFASFSSSSDVIAPRLGVWSNAGHTRHLCYTQRSYGGF